MATRHVEAARKREDKPISGSAANKAHDQLHRRGNTVSSVLDLMPNQILDSLKGYLDNIAATATQEVVKGGPLAELTASLAISVDTVEAQQK